MSSSTDSIVRLSAEEKLAAIREHLVNKVPVSEVCAKYRCAPSVFYKWQTDLFSQGAAVLEGKRLHKNGGTDKAVVAAQQKIARLESTLAVREQAISELVADNIRLKKIQNGEN